MSYIYAGAVIIFGTLLGLVVYLYREGAIASGKSEIKVLGLTIKLGNAQKKQDMPEPPAATL